MLPFPTRRIREGRALILIPDVEVEEPTKAPVFYNPRMRMNRDSAVLAASTLHSRLSRPLSLCEPMCGTGVRGIRLALEAEGVREVVMGDLNPLAVRLVERNISLNAVSDRVRVRLIDANLLLSLHDRPYGRFDYIDIDPFGSPIPFLDAAIRACRDGGVIALTATDMPPLCGVYPEVCLRRYGGLPLRTDYCHEVALRLLAGAVVTEAAKHDVAATPLFSYAADHYIRLYVSLEEGAREADRSLKRMGYLLHCFSCLYREAVGECPPDRRCPCCGSEMALGGPLWLESLSDPSFCSEMLSIAERRLDLDPKLPRILRLVMEEVELPPTFYHVDVLCSRLGLPSLPTDLVVSALKDAGYKASRTHINGRGVKTEASIGELEEVLRGISYER
jgi:tRNA (guanine26-N2/guanine27-N2)-dimethyltransferase